MLSLRPSWHETSRQTLKVILGAMMRARAGPRVAGVAVREIAGPCSTTLLHPLLRPFFSYSRG